MTRLRIERGPGSSRSFRGCYVSETTEPDWGLDPMTGVTVDELPYMARHLDKLHQQVEFVGVGVELKTDEHPLLLVRGFRRCRAQSRRSRTRSVITAR